ncbi:MAG: hypothetical protein J6Y80_07135 [Victivallales bacterium]|nr:hypothetical protein [Victivallales bacterium]
MKILLVLEFPLKLAEELQLISVLRRAGHKVRVAAAEKVLSLVTPAGWEALCGFRPVAFPEDGLPWAEVLVWNRLSRERARAARLRGCGRPMIDLGKPSRAAWSPDKVLARLEQLSQPQDFAGKTVLVTAGPTVEDIDPVRFITNRSSGKMGVAIAWAAAMRGARVLLVHGPMAAEVPQWPAVEALPVRSAQEMHDVVREHWQEAQVAVLCAAVADFRPDHYVPRKIKKIPGEGMVLSLERTPDILAELGAMPRHPFLVGFAAETDDVEINALNKLRKKHCDLLCANDIRQPGCGFAADTNQITVYAADGTVHRIPMMAKREAADEILKLVAKFTRFS